MMNSATATKLLSVTFELREASTTKLLEES